MLFSLIIFFSEKSISVFCLLMKVYEKSRSETGFCCRIAIKEGIASAKLREIRGVGPESVNLLANEKAISNKMKEALN